MPEVSVVITTYNEEKYIHDAIKSAYDQTLPKEFYEIIVVDDGGTDNTDKIVDKIKASGINLRYLKKKNGGTSSARNFGVQNSTGKYVSFLDGDDSYFPRKLELSLNLIRKYQDVGIVYSDYVEKGIESTNIRIKPNFDRDNLFNECIVSTNSMISREAFDRVGGFDTSFKYVEDYDFWCRVVMSGLFALRVPEILFTYNSHQNSKTNSTPLEKIKPEWDKIRERIFKNEWRI